MRPAITTTLTVKVGQTIVRDIPCTTPEWGGRQGVAKIIRGYRNNPEATVSYMPQGKGVRDIVFTLANNDELILTISNVPFGWGSTELPDYWANVKLQGEQADDAAADRHALRD